MTATIAEIECATAKLPLVRPLQAGALTIASREYCCVRVTLASGVSGEAFVITRGLDVGSALAMLFAPRVLGGGTAELDALRTAVRNVGWDGAISRAASALRLAGLDARARANGVPVWRELGGAAAPAATAAVVIGYTRKGDDPRAADLRAATAAVDAGARCLKLMAGAGGPSREIDRLKAVRAAVGDDVELALDVNGAWSLADARATLPRLAELGLSFVEEPWPYERGLAGFDDLPEPRPPLAAGEISASTVELEALAATGAVAHLRADATLTGGAESWRDLAPALEASGVAVFPHFWPEVHRHLLALAPRASYLECALPGGGEFALEDLCTPPVELHDGRIVAGEDPGFGFALDWDRIRRHAERPPSRLAA